jgi:hypothetical protein
MTLKLEIGFSLEVCGFVFGSDHVAFFSNVILHRAQYEMTLDCFDLDFGAPFSTTSASRVCLSSSFFFLFTASHILFPACFHSGFSLRPFTLQLHEYKLQSTTVGRLSQFRKACA